MVPSPWTSCPLPDATCHDDYFRSRSARLPAAATPRLRVVQQTLLAAALTPEHGPPRRRPSLCHDGTTVVYSQEVGLDLGPPGFRMLTEPGGVTRTVPEQIDVSLGLVDGLLQSLGWSGAAADVNDIVRAVLPPDPRALGAWWGGMWVGGCQRAEDLDLRLYCNMRHGNTESRWQRVAAVLATFGDDRLEAPLQDLANRTAPHARPVGLGVVIRDGRVPVLRVYCGVHQPERAALMAMLPRSSPAAREAIALLAAELGGDAGFPSQTVTMGFDFARDREGVIRPEVARTKVDVSCQWLPPAERQRFLQRAVCLGENAGLHTAALYAFTRDLTLSFGGYVPEYVSFTLGQPFTSMTLYAKPADAGAALRG